VRLALVFVSEELRIDRGGQRNPVEVVLRGEVHPDLTIGVEGKEGDLWRLGDNLESDEFNRG
jgi:hypothetical protein